MPIITVILCFNKLGESCRLVKNKKRQIKDIIRSAYYINFTPHFDTFRLTRKLNRQNYHHYFT
jgi:hypothetical protein